MDEPDSELTAAAPTTSRERQDEDDMKGGGWGEEERSECGQERQVKKRIGSGMVVVAAVVV